MSSSQAQTAAQWPAPWPIDRIIARLQAGDALVELVQAKRQVTGHDVREKLFESLVQSVLTEALGESAVIMRKQVQSVLQLSDQQFPRSSIPDVALVHGGETHFCEVKANRVDYDRFDCVLDSKPFRAFLESTGHRAPDPWEVEQDLIKLHLYKGLSDGVGSCLFLMVDAYQGGGRSWTRAFENRDGFIATMRTKLVQDWADRLLRSTRVLPLRSQGASANLIVCEVHGSGSAHR